MLNAVVHDLETLWLFTKSDFMTTMIPISIFAIVAAPLASMRNLPHLVFWLWFHLLHFNTSNQTASLEDETNKPDRPLPARRITLQAALILRWTLMPMCWALSFAYSKETMFASMALSAFTAMYNELRGSGAHFMTRYGLNGLGFAAFEAGTTLVAKDDKSCLDNAGWLAILLSASIFATTIYAQDFRDVIGDALINRDTIPLRLEALAGLRCCWVWWLGQSDFLGSGTLIPTARPHLQLWGHTQVWVSVAHVLPGYWRLLRAT
ncbi:hypothetical protein B0H19DRAFT_1380609 [Mycena capillaripes]|nr:hypothetical protein B0H19DRAFT_1380609 [Mycena capillaripes]